MELNPRIEWTFPLVQLLLRKHAQLPEPEQSKGLKVVELNDNLL